MAGDHRHKEEDEASEAGRLLAAGRKRAMLGCAECGRSFWGLSWARYCSHRCYMRAWRRRRRQAQQEQAP